MDNQTLVSLRGVQKKFGSHEVLTDITFDVHKGDIYGLIGRNGCGKTTIFKLLLGLSPVNGGEISISGSTNNKELRHARSKVGFSITPCFFDYMTAKQNLKYYCSIKGIKGKDEIDRVLKIVGLDGVKTKYRGFSLGMKQRLGIANAIMGNPELVIFDEPINGLDPQGIADIRNLIKTLNEQYGMTIIISSHILSELEHTATRFGIVNDGQIVAELTTKDLIEINDKSNIVVKSDKAFEASDILKANGIDVIEVAPTGSLEEYYFKLVGGRQ
ncbi:MAG: ATP-binding cassette domain-containing protein [Erysipelotrichaceae bacterium]|nr:ATP-binding cassette domain-containing protein [Erysipelotrichaceae bacterium]